MPSDPPLRFVVFDCDGTLVDSASAIIEAMNRAWDAEDLPAPDPTNVRSVVGLHLVEAIGRLHPEGSTTDHNRMADHYKGGILRNSKPARPRRTVVRGNLGSPR